MSVVLEGRDGWLFLDQDYYRSVAQYTGQLRLSSQDLQIWRIFFERTGTLAERNVKHVFLVAPSKETIFPHVYPHRRSQHMPVDDIVREIGPDELCYPVGLLADPAAALPTYPKTDGHWTDYASMLVATALLTRFGRAVQSPQPASFVFRRGFFDLGSKVKPPVSEELPFDDRRPERLSTFDNMLPLHGRILVFDNPDADPGTCVIFGDSFAVMLCKWLCWSFRRIVFMHGTDIDWSVIEAEQPVCVLTEKGERGLISPFGSAPDFSTKALVRWLIDAPNNPRRETQIAAFPVYWGQPFDA